MSKNVHGGTAGISEEDDVIDLGYIFTVLKKHILFIVLISLICGIASFCVAQFFLEKKYESKALLYVENTTQKTESVNVNDITAAQKLVNTCEIIFKSDTVLEELKNDLNLSYSVSDLNNMISVSSVNSTEVMEVVVETNSAEESQEIVNKLLDLYGKEFKRVIKSGSLEIIDYGKLSSSPSYPNVTKVTLIGVLIGAVVACGIVIVAALLDVTVKADDNLAKIYDVPVFAEVTDYAIKTSDGKHYSAYGTKYSGKQTNSEKQVREAVSFAITESYNTARTNIMFAAATSKRKIIAVTSSGPSEGKSTTCARLAASFANAGNKVLLVECDLRKPVVAKNFNLRVRNGLSGILGGFCTTDDAIVQNVYDNLDVLPAGDIPPNPSELLASDAMKDFLKYASENYDYTFLDTPPVNVVTDSQLLNDEIAGFVFVVRENETTHPDVEAALEKITLAKGKTLGFVKTFCKPEKSSGKYSKYGSKYSYYKYGYGYVYGASDKKESDKKKEKKERYSDMQGKKTNSAGTSSRMKPGRE